ncbi:hypothetical protein MY5147_001495 [Beauveria neobassiana]
MDSMLDLASLPRTQVEALIHKNSNDFDLLSPAEYYDSLMAFTLHIRDHDNPFQLLSPTHKLPGAPVLHDLGCIVMEASRGSKSGLASVLWFTAASWGFGPSACSLVAILAAHGEYGKSTATAPAERRFRALVKAGDPVAMAIEGDILYRQGKYGEAEAILRKVQQQHAADLANWEPNFRLALGKTLARRGKTDQAIAMLRALADDGYIEADQQLGSALRSTDPDEALQYLFKAGCTGALHCFEEMATIELDKAANAKNSSDAADHRLWAGELARLADRKAEF